MTPDYRPKTYYSMNRKRQIIDAMIEELHAQHELMIEQALAQSNMQQARDVIKYIKERT